LLQVPNVAPHVEPFATHWLLMQQPPLPHALPPQHG
jgi:hypothetical protein